MAALNQDPNAEPFIGAPEADPANAGMPGNDLPAPPKGLIDSAFQPAQAAPVTAAPTLPTLGNVNAATDTTAGQMDTLLSKDNPYITRARASAAEVANSRGLLNSSIAAGAGETAAISAALPIASQAADTYSTQRLANQGATNQFGLQEAGGKIQTSLQQLRGDQAKQVADIEANYKTLMQTSASSASMFNEITGNISKILDDPNTTVEQKQAAVDNQIQLLRAGMAISGGIANLDLNALLDFSGGAGINLPPVDSSGSARSSSVVITTEGGDTGQMIEVPQGIPVGGTWQVGDRFYRNLGNGQVRLMQHKGELV
jgi:hypothetical protein